MPKGDEVDYDTVKQLINRLHLSDTQVESLNYQLKHKELQLKSLLASEQQHRIEMENVSYQLAKSEQDNILLEVIARV